MIDFDQVINGDIECPSLRSDVVEYLTTIFSASYQLRLNTHSKIVQGGATESYAFGYVAGLQAAADLLKQIQKQQQGEWDTELSTFGE